MGQWQGPDDFDALMSIYKATRPAVPVAEFFEAIYKSGMLTRKAYYVPDADELFGLMRRLTFGIDVPRDGWRWVMCRETIDALARKYDSQRTPKPARFDASWWTASDLPSAALEMEVEMVIEANRYWGEDKARMFGVSIRVDPAARSPMFEIDDEKLKPAAAKVPTVERNEP